MNHFRIAKLAQAGVLVAGLIFAAVPGVVQRHDSAALANSLSPQVNEGHAIPEVAAGEVSDEINAAEMQDLMGIAEQTGVPVEDVIQRVAWNDNFSFAVTELREANPYSFSAAEIVDANHAWIAFKGPPPDVLGRVLDGFSHIAPHVEIEIRTTAPYSELELQTAIESTHYTVLSQPGVLDATTSYDEGQLAIVTNVLLADSDQDAVLHGLNKVATEEVANAIDASTVTASVVVGDSPSLGGDDSASFHYGGEILTGCTSGFGTRATGHTSGTRGISTAGHCNNSQTDDGFKLVFKDAHNGSQGDFQWHTGPKAESDDFYAGTASITETARRDVSGIGTPTVGQYLCKNGKTNHFQCQNVRKLNVCRGNTCNLVQMGARIAAGGDSGGPVYFGNTAYGLHKGWMNDPAPPFDRDLFSRADRIDNALGIWIATN